MNTYSTSGRRSGAIGSSCLWAVGAALLSSTTADAGEPVAYVRAWVGGIQILEEAVALQPGPGGSMQIFKQVQREGLLFTWQYAADPDPSGVALLNGKTVVHNPLQKSVEVGVELVLPLCPGIEYNPARGHPKPKIGGQASVRINADADGGSIVCAGDSKVLDVTLGTAGSETLPLYHCPFELKLTGSGSAMTSTEFGAPYPSLAVATPLHELGHRAWFTITSGDKATFGLLYVASGTIELPPPPQCEGDVNGDGVVDAIDLAAVLSVFEQPAGCNEPGDLDGNGQVDAVDLVVVLQHWGECPPPM